MGIDKKILEEIKRYKSITTYINEQAADAAITPPPPPAGEPPIGDVAGGEVGDVPATPPPPTGGEDTTATGATEVDITQDEDVEEITDESGEETGTEEIDITDLIDSQKTMTEKQEEYFNNLFSQLNNLETKLSEMDQLVNKINSLESKIESMRPKTPEEKLELRSLDSGPLKQKLSDFFVNKQEEMKQSGKNEYVLTTDEVEEYSPEEVKTSFNDYEENEDENMM